MAKVTGPLHSTEARGRVGGLIFNTWRGISYAKAKQAPAQPRTELQLMIRSFGIQATRNWQELDPAERATWDAYAVAHPDIDWTGNSKRLTGANWYLRLAVRLLLLNQAVPVTAPVVVSPPPVAGLAATPSAGQLSVAWTAPSTPTQYVELWLDGPRSAGRQPSLVRARRVASEASPTGHIVLDDLQAGTYTVFARAVILANGLVSTWESTTQAVS